MNYQFAILLLAVFSIAVSGCGTTLNIDSHGTKHILALNGNGGIYDIKPEPGKLGKTFTGPEGLRDQVQDIISNIKRENKNRILIYVHGGLNSIQASVKNAKTLIDLMKQPTARNDGDEYYPIILNWESGMIPAYTDHLFRIRQGKEDLVFGILTSPFYFFADVGRALTRYPVTMATQFYRGLFPIPVSKPEEVVEFNERFFLNNPAYPKQILLGENKIERGDGSWYADRATLFFPGVMRFLTTPLLDAFGKSGWDNMLRRTQTVFRKPKEFDPDSFDPTTNEGVALLNRASVGVQQLSDSLAGAPAPSLHPILKPGDPNSSKPDDPSNPTGGLSYLMEKLRKLKEEEPYKDLKVTLIGHSMGAIILNELLRLYGDMVKDFRYDEIVYLAAACTIRDFEQSVIPYLKANEHSKFYNVTLHPVADRREKTFWDLLPRGSLLDWIDDYASSPASFMELTLGKWNNAIMAWHIIPDVVRRRHQVTLKGFGMEDPIFNNRKDPNDLSKILIKKPQEHGDFNDAQQLFWQPAYWRSP